MDWLALFYSPSGRIARTPFAIGVVLVYLASFGSRALLAAPVMGQASVVPFMALQVLVIWAWYALHAKRLHDTDRTGASAIAIAIVYAFGVCAVALIAMLLTP